VWLVDLPGDDALRSIVRATARLRASCRDAIGAPDLVQPTGQFFPDAFQLDAPSVERLLRRMIGYSPVADDLGIELAFVEAEDGGHSGGCGSLACGTGGGARAISSVQEIDDGYRVLVAVNDVRNPDVLTTSLARSVGALVLHEAGLGHDGQLDAGDDEIAAAACGFGVLLANGAAVWAKSCGGLRVAQATVLSVEEAAVALALFVAVHGVKPSAARAHLGATQREAFDLAEAWVDSNPLLVETLRDRPELLESGVFTMEPVRGLVGRWLHKRKLDKEMTAHGGAAPAPAPLSDDKRRRLEEARALVDEVFDAE
jgi:hypothetical protein